MRIVQVSDCYLPRMGGIETQVSRLSEQLVEAGHEVIILTATAEGENKGLTAPTESRNARESWVDRALLQVADQGNQPSHPQVIRSAWPNPLGLPVDPRAGRRFAQLIRELHPDVINFHMGEVTPVVMDTLVRLRAAGLPTVVTIHSVWSNGATVTTYRAAAKALGLNTEPIIWSPVSDLVARNVRRVVRPALIQIQGNGVNQQQWRGQPVPHQGLRAVAATRFAPRKRVPDLLRILKHVGDALGINHAADESPARNVPTPNRGTGIADDAPDDVPNGILEVVLAGEGPELDRARHFLDEHGMTGWVKTPGRLTQPELQNLYRRSDVFLAPGIKDSFSIAGREGLVAGLAVLTRSQSGLGADLENGVEGRSVPSDPQMAATLVQWAREPALVAKMKDHNLTCDYPYSWERVIPQTLKMYEDAARIAQGRRIPKTG